MTKLPINQVVTGDCREIMTGWPSGCIDFVMFSPPFWGLRDYGEEAESVWGGDSDCEHDFEVRERKTTQGGNPGTTAQVGATKAGVQRELIEEGFCSKCGAWRGQLGLEPDYRLYVQHLVEVGREIKRILKPSGSWYLNLGDTYCSSPPGNEDFSKSGLHGAQSSERYKETLKEGHNKTMDKTGQGIPKKCKMLMPYRVALALINDGWICRNDIIWLKPNPMPSSVKDRLNTTTERIFHFVKEKQYYYDLDAIREPHKQESKERDKYSYNSALGARAQMPDEKREDVTPEESALNPEGKNPGDVIKAKWSNVPNQPTQGNFGYGGTHGNLFNHPKGKNPGDVIEQTTEPFPEAHFAVYPPDLCEKPIKSSCPKDGIVLDPMCGAGSTLVMAKQLGRNYIGIEISEEYAEIARNRLRLGDERYKQRKRKERRLEREAGETAKLEAFVND